MSNATRHILVVDDNLSIHDDFRKIFGGLTLDSSDLDSASAELFGTSRNEKKTSYQLDFASQGQEGLEILWIELLGVRQLPQHRPELGAQLGQALRIEALDRLAGLGQHPAIGG